MVVKFEPYKPWSGNDDNLIVKGKIEAIGSPTEKIVFTSIDDDEYGGDTKNDGITTSISYWNRIHFTPEAATSTFQNVIISYGGLTGLGWYPYLGVVYVEKNSVIFEDVYFKNNGPSAYTLYLENSTSTVRNSIFENSWIAINIVGQDQNVFENNAFQNCNCYVMKDNQCISPISSLP
ncbi:MAG: right-handed parallel beta-helix repeat-containing protein [Candidatus Nealsonbacteria bacterium]|nr:right-handed parallel beta-helix repeat-containing protein [Candidatus Nealsonbacteria bacterium]